MKEPKNNQHTERSDALRALKNAIVEGATWRYEQLVALALKAGVTDEEIDNTAHEAMQALLARAEQPLNPRQLAHDWPAVHFRR